MSKPALRMFTKCPLWHTDFALRCLHHRKEAKKVLALQNAYQKREAATPRDDAPSAGQIRSLGLLDAKDEEKNMKHGNLLPTVGDNSPGR